VNLPSKRRTPDVHKDVDAAPVSVAATTTHDNGVNIRLVHDDSQPSTHSSSGSRTEIVPRYSGGTKTCEGSDDGHTDAVKKLRLQKHAEDSLPVSPIDARHLQNVATFGAECLGARTAKVTYVGSGLMPLSSPASLPSVVGMPMLSYALYTSTIRSGQAPSRSQSTAVSSPQHTVGRFPSSDFDAVQTSTAADMPELFSADSSVIDTEVVETVGKQSSLDCIPKHCHLSLHKQKQATDGGTCLLKCQHCVVTLQYGLDVLAVSIECILSLGFYVCGLVAQSLGRWSCDQQVACSAPGCHAFRCNPGQVVLVNVPL